MHLETNALFRRLLDRLGDIIRNCSVFWNVFIIFWKFYLLFFPGYFGPARSEVGGAGSWRGGRAEVDRRRSPASLPHLHRQDHVHLRLLRRYGRITNGLRFNLCLKTPPAPVLSLPVFVYEDFSYCRPTWPPFRVIGDQSVPRCSLTVCLVTVFVVHRWRSRHFKHRIMLSNPLCVADNKRRPKNYLIKAPH